VSSFPAARFDYVEADATLGPASALPYAPLILQYADWEIRVSGLVDSGATLNVLPYDVGLQLGAVWDRQTVPVQLAGNLADVDARALLVTGRIGPFAPVRLAFAWTRSNRIPIILGQINFFMEFDVRFCRWQSYFEVWPRER
jgi:hypothetical protein